MPNWTIGIEPLRTAATTGQVTGTNSAVIVLATSTIPSSGCIVVKADSANTNNVYVGFISNISSTNGFVLYPRDSFSIDWDHNATPLYCYFLGTAQKIYYAVAS